MDDFSYNDFSLKHRGFRLQKLEVLNWGTFDSSQGEIHVVRPAGQSTLLIGRNGSGKSTLVDAILTLLVRPGVRNYNVAAGASKQERDERSYIKGAFGRSSRDEDNRADVQYLRPDGSSYAALLAHFHNFETDEGFTIAQVLYLNSEARADKMYCFAEGERSILADLSDLKGMEKLKQQLQKRGFKATPTYQEYHGWFVKATGVQPKAMDMFNQTVAVKDIQSLNRFIRDHMLEAKPWDERIEELLNHFTQLSEAHHSLVGVRRQAELLEPVAEKGTSFREQSQQLQEITLVLDAAESYFRQKTIELFTPVGEARRDELARAKAKREQFGRDIEAVQEECRRLKNEIDNAGGERLKQIPLLISHEQTQAANKRDAYQRYHDALGVAETGSTAKDEATFEKNREKLAALVKQLDEQIVASEQQHIDLAVEKKELGRELHDCEQELRALEQRQGNVPQKFVDVRRQLCHDLRLAEKDIPFVAELMFVKPDERAWEASIEMVLRSFALSLLVPQRLYRLVSGYIEKTRLTDSRGSGARLVYLSVGKRANEPAGPPPHTQSMLRKLQYRDGHPLLPWLKGELDERFDYRCCETIEEFQEAAGLAMTRGRHVKNRGVRHEKDDRDGVTDPRFFVLGWDNQEKRRRFAEDVRRLRESLQQLDQNIERLASATSQLRLRSTAARGAMEFTSFSAIHFAVHEKEIASLELEKKRLEENNQVVKTLKERLGQAEAKQLGFVAARDEVVGQVRELENEIAQGDKLLQNAQAMLKKWEKDGSLATHSQQFSKLDSHFKKHSLAAETLLVQESKFKDAQRIVCDRLRKHLDPLHDELCACMNRFLREFAEERADLEAKVEFLDSFLGLRERIQEEDLPRHEQRFKERLNEKVIHDVGLLNGRLQSERSEIVSKIDLLNKSLMQLEYRTGTHMKLEPRPVRDPEITEFQTSLKACLEGTFEGTPEADEACYIRIEKLVERLRKPDRWREKVTDVRRWFDFVAREIDAETGKECGYYEDSAGQSGGEKAKLAFTILVAAIAYQFNIDPAQPTSERFHFVVVDEMFSKVDDQYAEYALELFKKFGLQLLIVAPLDAKARITEPYVGCYAHVIKEEKSSRSEIFTMTAHEFQETMSDDLESQVASAIKRSPVRPR